MAERIINVKTLFIVFIAGFFVNLMWEIAHTSLYTCIYEKSLAEYLPMLLQATFGDGIIMALLYILGSWVNKNPYWIKNIETKDYAVISLLGLTIAVALEHVNVNILERWAYTASMPIVPGIGLGVTPLLQLMILPFATFWIAALINKKFK